jgi:hypothetical protein
MLSGGDSLREAVFECFLEFDVNTDYALFRKRQVQRFLLTYADVC